MLNRKSLLALGGVATLALSVAACGSNETDTGGGAGSSGVTGDPFTIGTTDTVTALDPAGSYDLGSWTLSYNIYQTLLTIPAGENVPQGDAAESCEYNDPQTLTCTLMSGLTFSNGDELTSSDVKFSIERNLKIADPNGASGLLATVDTIDTPDDTTVVFHLNRADTTFQFVLTTPAASIVDEELFPADKKLADDQVIGSGPYKLSQYKPGEQAVLEVNDSYQGDNTAQAPQVFVAYYQEPSALKLAAEDNDIDIAWRSLSPTDLNDLKGNADVTVAQGEGSEIRYWVWDVAGPVGKEEAVRQAAAQIIDRDAIAQNSYDGTVEPLYSIVPPGFPGQVDAFQEQYGEADTAAAEQLLKDAGVSTPVKLTLGYTPTHYGPNAVDEATEFQRQLNESGLFDVELKSAEWEQYQTIYKQGAYDLWMLGWFPDFLDADNYLAPFMVDGGFFENGYSNPKVNDLVAQEEASSDTAEREQAFQELQAIAATDVPFIPSWVGKNVAVYGPGMSGVEDTLDPAFIFRFWMISKNG